MIMVSVIKNIHQHYISGWLGYFLACRNVKKHLIPPSKINLGLGDSGVLVRDDPWGGRPLSPGNDQLLNFTLSHQEHLKEISVWLRNKPRIGKVNFNSPLKSAGYCTQTWILGPNFWIQDRADGPRGGRSSTSWGNMY